MGGKNEPGETDRETVEREVKEEIGIDLSSSDYIALGQLDERQVTSLRDNKLLMMLIPFGKERKNIVKFILIFTI